MCDAVLWGHGRVIGGALLSHGRKKGKNPLHSRRAATKSKKSPRENGWLGFNHESSGRKILIRSAAHKALAGDIDEEMVAAKEVLAKDRLFHVRQEKFVHHTKVREGERNRSLSKVLIEDPLAEVKRDRDGDFICSADAGKTDTSAPLSTKKERRWQTTESAPS